MMKFAKHLYLSEGMEKKKSKVIRRLRAGRLQAPVYLIALCDHGRERMEILCSAELLQKSYPTGELFIAGIAGDYDDALELVRQITQETFDAHMDTDVCGYIHYREQEE
ncbi:hypothetical protein [Lachnoclostridium sp. An118]|uniref:hypothetical protein n=1 Tax=Lachnoclostridium sp. An118 TaxID=1965547 RepID=UPI0013A666B8|nr:hypothetical protein [Lachnoclostridium sp. An118]HJA42937.1 hypothetical protein [Candidatus Dorea stercoravium]